MNCRFLGLSILILFVVLLFSGCCGEGQVSCGDACCPKGEQCCNTANGPVCYDPDRYECIPITEAVERDIFGSILDFFFG